MHYGNRNVLITNIVFMWRNMYNSFIIEVLEISLSKLVNYR